MMGFVQCLVFLFTTLLEKQQFVLSYVACSRYDDVYHNTYYIDCETECCGDIFNRYCCAPDVTIRAVSGGISVVVVLTIIAVVCCCCCKRSRGRAGQVIRSVNTTPTVNIAPGYNLQGPQTTNVGFRQHGYNNVAAPAYIQTTNTQPADVPKWQDPPPPYEEVIHSPGAIRKY